MQLGKSLIGAIIGAAIGVGIMVAVYFLFQWQEMWLAIVVALATGFGVRMLVATSGHMSIVRGALTCILALLAYLAGWRAVAVVATQRANALQKPVAMAPRDQPTDNADNAGDEPVAAQPAPVEMPSQAPQTSGGGSKLKVPQEISPLAYVWLAVAALIAYELGRGTAAGRGTVVETAPGRPVGAHPDA